MRGVRVVLEILFVVASLTCFSANGTVKNPAQPVTEATRVQAAAAFEEARATYARHIRSTKPPPHHRSAGDLWLMALMAVTLAGHQMRRKHRFLRPHAFGF